jgi:predicted phage terminase large subunit-like protein
MGAMVRLEDGRELSRDQAEHYLELLRERHRRREADRVAHDRAGIVARCQGLHGFIEEFWYVLEPVAQFRTGWALRAMCAHLEAVTAGEFLRLLMTVPPGMMKSLLLVFWTAWEWGPKGLPHIQVLATSYSQANAFRDNMKLRDLVKSEKFQALWPLTIRDDADAKGRFVNTASGFSEARPFSKMTGGRANRVKIDDPHDTEAAESDVQRGKALRIMREAISDRTNDAMRDAIVLIMQRLHAQDCASAALAMDYVHLELPMEFEPERRCVTPIFTDPRTTDGELLFPERFPASAVANLKRDKGSYAYAGQYQQRPSPRDGGLFSRAWFEVVGAAPVGANRRVRAWDLGATQGGGDATVGVLMERAPDGIFYVLDVVRDRLSPAGVERLILATASQDGAGTTIRLPQDPGQAGKAQAQTYVGKLAGLSVRVVQPTGDKFTRATPAAAQAEAGNVKLLRGPWNEAFMDELCTFPAGAHDDQVDAFADALNEIALGSAFNWYVSA